MHGLRQFPSMAREIRNDPRTLAVLIGPDLLDHSGTTLERTGKSSIDVRHAYLDQVRGELAGWRDPIASGLCDDHGSVRPDTQLGSV